MAVRQDWDAIADNLTAQINGLTDTFTTSERFRPNTLRARLNGMILENPTPRVKIDCVFLRRTAPEKSKRAYLCIAPPLTKHDGDPSILDRGCPLICPHFKSKDQRT